MQTFTTFGPYTLYRRLAVGGMAEIFLARTDSIDQWVALKIMLPHNAGNTEHELMFMDEAQLLKRIRHPNIVAALDVLRVEDRIAVALEYVPGNDLSVVLKRMRETKTQMPTDLAIEIAMGIASGLHYAHTLSGEDGAPLYLVHRDVTPENILLGVDGSVKIADFGVAKARGFNQVETKTGIIKGKLRYMAPEYATGNMQDVRSDLFSLGLCLYEMLAGVHPYDSAALGPELVQAIQHAKVPPLESTRPEAPPLLLKLLSKALAVNPLDRFTTGESFRRALEKVRRQTPHSGITLAPFLRRLGLAPSLPILGSSLRPADDSADRATALEPTGQMSLSVARIPIAEPRPDIVSLSGYNRVVKRHLAFESKSAAVVEHQHPSTLSGLIELNAYVEPIEDLQEVFNSTPMSPPADVSVPDATTTEPSRPMVAVFDGDELTESAKPSSDSDEISPADALDDDGDANSTNTSPSPLEITDNLPINAVWTGPLDDPAGQFEEPQNKLERTDMLAPIAADTTNPEVNSFVAQAQQSRAAHPDDHTHLPEPTTPSAVIRDPSRPSRPPLGSGQHPQPQRPTHPTPIAHVQRQPERQPFNQPPIVGHPPSGVHPTVQPLGPTSATGHLPHTPSQPQAPFPPAGAGPLIPPSNTQTAAQRPFGHSGVFNLQTPQLAPSVQGSPIPGFTAPGFPANPDSSAQFVRRSEPVKKIPASAFVHETPIEKRAPMKLRTDSEEEEDIPHDKPKYSPIFIKLAFAGVAALVVMMVIVLLWALS